MTAVLHLGDPNDAPVCDVDAAGLVVLAEPRDDGPERGVILCDQCLRYAIVRNIMNAYLREIGLGGARVV